MPIAASFVDGDDSNDKTWSRLACSGKSKIPAWQVAFLPQERTPVKNKREHPHVGMLSFVLILIPKPGPLDQEKVRV
jgi:hypothetical protein